MKNTNNSFTYSHNNSTNENQLEKHKLNSFVTFLIVSHNEKNLPCLWGENIAG